MKVYSLGRIPKGSDSEYYTYTTFGEYDLEDVYKTNADAAFYWYAQGNYEGTGWLLLVKEGQWYLHSCSHCSCNGPTEGLVMLPANGKTLERVEQECSDDCHEEIQPLIDLAREKGYK